MYSVKLAYDDADLRTRLRISLTNVHLLSRLYRLLQLSRIFLCPRLIRLRPGEFDVPLLYASANMETVEPCEMSHLTTRLRHGVVKHRVSFKGMRQSKLILMDTLSSEFTEASLVKPGHYLVGQRMLRTE